MKPIVVIACIAVAGALVLKRLGARRGEGWEARIARMPDNSRPRWLFSNIAAIRQNTDEILKGMDAPATG